MKSSNTLVKIAALFFIITGSLQAQNLASFEPANGAQNVLNNAQITILFKYNEPINSSKVTASSFVVVGDKTGVITGVLSNSKSNSNLSESSNYFVFTPNNNFKPGEKIRVTLTADLLTVSKTFYFTVKAVEGGVPEANKTLISNAENGAQEVMTADLDKDGDLDVLSVSLVDNSIVWFQNDGASSPNFTKKTISTDLSGATSIAVGDVDKDGFLDVISSSKTDNTVAWYKNNGAAVPIFSKIIINTSAMGASRVRVGDLDNDGDLDLVSSSANDDTINWYENDGAENPSFTTHTISNLDLGAASIAIGDINNDGNLDIVSAARTGDSLISYVNDGAADPTFTRTVISSTVDGINAVSLSDIDKDGDLDILMASVEDDTIAWYKNNGLATSFTKQVISSTINGAASIDAADIDGDGNMDVLAAGYYDHSIAWYRSDGLATPSFTKNSISTSNGAISITTGDLDGDGDLDVLSAGELDNTIAWYKTVDPLTSSTPTNHAAHITQDANITLNFNTTFPAALANSTYIKVSGSYTGEIAGVFTGGDTNTIVFNPTNNFKAGEKITVTTVKNSSFYSVKSFSFIADVPNTIVHYSAAEPPITLENSTTKDSYKDVKIFDIDKDGDLDIIIGGAYKITMFLNNGNTNPTYTEQTIKTFSSGVKLGTAFFDFDGDGDIDIAYFEPNKSYLQVLLNDGSSTPNFTLIDIDSIVYHNNKNLILKAADLNNDGYMDIVTEGVAGTFYYLNDGNSTPAFKETEIGINAALDQRREFVLADVDNDGLIDVLALNYQGEVYWYKNSGGYDPNFTKYTIATGINSMALGAGDVDGDGDLDVFVGSNEGANSKIVWYKNNGAALPTFTESTIISIDNYTVENIKLMDVDSDNDLDLVYTQRDTDTHNSLTWLRNGGGNTPSFTKNNIAAISDEICNFDMGDLDNDGDIDFVVTSNTKSTLVNDINPFGLKSASPTTNSQNVPVDSNLVFTFNLLNSNTLDAASISSETIKVSGSQSGAIAGTISINNDEVTFNPNSNFLPGETITATVTAGVQSNGTALYNPTSLNFICKVPLAARIPVDGTAAVLLNSQSSTNSITYIKTVDINGDGNLDFIASIKNVGLVWFESSGGTSPKFTQHVITDLLPNTINKEFIDYADMDGDGDLDIVRSFRSNSTKLIWYKNSGGTSPTFTTNTLFDFNVVSTNADNIRVADMDNDGHKDVVVVGWQYLYWLKNDGAANPTFSIHTIASHATFESFTLQDVDNDGDMDVLGQVTAAAGVATSGSDNGALKYFLNNGESIPSFTEKTVLLLINGNYLGIDSSIQQMDIDRDGDPDIIANYEWALDNNGNTPVSYSKKKVVDTANRTEYGDMNADGYLDFVSISYLAANNYIVWRLNNSNSSPFTFTKTVVNPNLDKISAISLGDLDNDGRLDMLVTYLNVAQQKYQLMVYYGKGSNAFTGATDNSWNTASNWSFGTVPVTSDDVYIPSSLTANLDLSNTSVANLNLSGTLNIPATSALTISGDLIQNGALTIASDATNSGSLALRGNYLGTANSGSPNNTNYQRYITTNAAALKGWHLIASPVQYQRISDFKNLVLKSDNKYAIATYDNHEPIGSRYVYFTDNTGSHFIDYAYNFTKGEGYSIKTFNTGVLNFSGLLNSTDATLNITDNYSDGFGSGDKWNLLGNPFTAPISLNTASDATNNFLSVNADQLDPNRVAVYLWNESTSSYDIVNQANESAKYVVPGQGFFVESIDGGSTVTITKAMQSSQNVPSLLKPTNKIPAITLTISDKYSIKKTQIKYFTKSTMGLDLGYDAGVFSGVSSDFNIYTELLADNKGVAFALQCLPTSNYKNMVIPIGVQAKSGSTVDFTAQSVNLPEGIQVFLEDRETGIYTNLQNNATSYTVNFARAINGTGRFFLHTTANKPLDVKDELFKQSIKIYNTSNMLHIKGLKEGKATITIFDTIGKQVLYSQFTGKSSNAIVLPNLKTGVYIVKLKTARGSITNKIVL